VIAQVLNREFVLDQMRRVRHEVERAGDDPELHRILATQGIEPHEHAAVLKALRDAEEREASMSSGQKSGYETPPTDRPGDAYNVAPIDDLSFFSRDPMVSLFQSVLHEHFEASLGDELEPAGPDAGPPGEHVAVADTSLRSSSAERVQGRRRFGRFEKSDPRWVYSAFAMAWRKFHGRHAFNPRPASPLAIPANARLILVGDWGTGIPRAQKVAELIGSCLEQGRRRGLEQHVVHLGDVYYSGLRLEYEKRFLPYWPVAESDSGTIGSWSLCGNHDMYSGGEGYYDSLLQDQRFARQEHSSCFSLETPHWQILGLDTAWDDHALEEPQPAWVQSKLDESDRKLVLLSHHPLFSAYEAVGPSLLRALERPLASGRVKSWYWGHEHRCMLFKPHQGVPYARCVGHGGVPVYMSHRSGDPIPEPGSYEYRAYITSERERWALFGFAVLDFAGPTIGVRYIDEFGRVSMTEEIS
jgi:hypothetical protein